MTDIARSFYAATQTDQPDRAEFPPNKNFENEQHYSLYRAYNHPIYGRVQLYKENSTSRLIMAITSLLTDKNEAAELLSCLRIRQNLNHRNLLYMLGYSNKSKKGLCSSDFNVSAFFEFPLTNLARDVKERQTKSEYYTPDELICLVSQMLDVLVHLNDKGLCHGNICPKTIQHRRATKTFVLLDHFGEKRTVEKFHREQLILADEIFLSPELYGVIADEYYHINGEKEIDLSKNDIFSLGMVVLHLGLFKSIQDVYASDGDINREKLAAHIRAFEDRYAEKIPLLIHVLKLMLTTRTAERPTSYELKSTVKIGFGAMGNGLSFSGSREKSNSLVLEELNLKDKKAGDNRTDVTNFLNTTNKNDCSFKPVIERAVGKTPDLQPPPRSNNILETENDNFFMPTQESQYRSRIDFFELPMNRHQIVNVEQAATLRRDSRPYLSFAEQGGPFNSQNSSSPLVNVPSIQLFNREPRHFETAPRGPVHSTSQNRHPTQMSLEKHPKRSQVLLTDQTMRNSGLYQSNLQASHTLMPHLVQRAPNPALFHSTRTSSQINVLANEPQTLQPLFRHGSISTIEQPRRVPTQTNEGGNIQNVQRKLAQLSHDQRPKKYQANIFSYHKPQLMIYQHDQRSQEITTDKNNSAPFDVAERDDYLNIYSTANRTSKELFQNNVIEPKSQAPFERRPTKTGGSIRYVLDAPQSNWKTDAPLEGHQLDENHRRVVNRLKAEPIRTRRPPINSTRFEPTPVNVTIEPGLVSYRPSNDQPRIAIPQSTKNHERSLVSKFNNQSTRQFYAPSTSNFNRVRKGSFA